METASYTYDGTVTNVVDGDTVDVLVDLGFNTSLLVRFRLARIDTPERGQPGFHTAKDHLINLFSSDPSCTVSSIKRGKFRYVCELYHNSLNVNDDLLARNLAKLYGT